MKLIEMCFSKFYAIKKYFVCVQSMKNITLTNYRGIMFVPLGFKRLGNLNITFANNFLNIFPFIGSSLLKNSPLNDDKFIFAMSTDCEKKIAASA